MSDRDIYEQYFYGIATRPPAIVEFDMLDVDNVIINKVFKVETANDPYVGQLSLAVNKNYIVHLLINPDNGR